MRRALRLWAFRQAFEDNIALPSKGFVMGAPVSVIAFDFDGNERRGRHRVFAAITRQAEHSRLLRKAAHADGLTGDDHFDAAVLLTPRVGIVSGHRVGLTQPNGAQAAGGDALR